MQIPKIPWAIVLSGFACIAAVILLSWYLLTKNQSDGLLVELTGIFLEIFLIVIVVDQLGRYRESQKRAVLRQGIAFSMQRSLVDLMRINHLFHHQSLPDGIRLAEFLDIARFSLSDLRSQIEALSGLIEGDVLTRYRSIERQLNHIFRSFHSISLRSDGSYQQPVAVYYEHHIFFAGNHAWKTLRFVAADIEEHLEREGEGWPRDNNAWLLAECEKSYRERNMQLITIDSFYAERFRLQDAALTEYDLPYVLLDASDEVSIAYFHIDAVLLKELEL